MAVRLEPQNGVYIKKSLGIDEPEDVVRVFKVINDGSSTMFLRYPDLSSLTGVVIEPAAASGRSPDIDPGQSYSITVRVKRDYINGFDEEQIIEQFVNFKVEGYAPPVLPPTPDDPAVPDDPTQPRPVVLYYTLSVDQIDESVVPDNSEFEIVDGQAEFKVGVRLIAVYDNGDRNLVWPEGGFRFDPNSFLDQGQLRIVTEERLGSLWVVQFENRAGNLLDANWTAKVRSDSYVNQAGAPASQNSRFFVVPKSTEIIPTDTDTGGGGTGGGGGGGPTVGGEDGSGGPVDETTRLTDL